MTLGLLKTGYLQLLIFLNQIQILKQHSLIYSTKTNVQNSNMLERLADYIDRFGYPFCRGRIFDTLEEDKGQYDGNEAVFWASGACLFIRNKLFNELEGFDEDFFMHQEEIDLCWRIRNFGGTTYSIGGSKVYHLGGASLPNSPLKVFYNYRNSLYMLLKNIPSIQLPLIFIIRLTSRRDSWICVFLLKGRITNCFEYIKGSSSMFTSTFFRMFKKRRKTSSQTKPYYQT